MYVKMGTSTFNVQISFYNICDVFLIIYFLLKFHYTDTLIIYLFTTLKVHIFKTKVFEVLTPFGMSLDRNSLYRLSSFFKSYVKGVLFYHLREV